MWSFTRFKPTPRISNEAREQFWGLKMSYISDYRQQQQEFTWTLAQPQRQRKKSIKVLAWKHNLEIFFAELFFQAWKVSGSVSAVGLGSKLSFIKPRVELRGLMERRIYFFFKKTVKITQILNLRSSISETPWVSSLALGGHMVLIEERRLWHQPPKWNLGVERWKI